MNEVLVTITTALVGALALWFEDWRERRSIDATRQRILRDAKDEVAFLKEWLTVQESLNSAEAELARVEVRTQLARIYRRVAVLDTVEPTDNLSGVRRLLLLHLSPTDLRVRVARTAYYLSLLYLTFLLGAAINELGVKEDPYFTFMGNMSKVAVLGLGPALLLRWVALRVARRSPTLDAEGAA